MVRESKIVRSALGTCVLRTPAMLVSEGRQYGGLRNLRPLAMALVLFGAPAAADVYPSRTVRIITGGVGTFHDIVTRYSGAAIGERWGQPVEVENQPAAALTIGTGIAARAPADGYTLLMSDRSALAVAPYLYKNLPYDVAKDFSPITLSALAPTMLVAHPSLPATTMAEFLVYAKAQPHDVQFATAGPGTNNHIAMEILKKATGIDAVAIHYKGGAASTLAIVSGEVKVGFAAVPNVLPQVRGGKLKAFVVTSRERFPDAPDVPTAAEAGLPGLELEFWIGPEAPASTPQAILTKINQDVGEILRTPGSIRDATAPAGERDLLLGPPPSSPLSSTVKRRK